MTKASIRKYRLFPEDESGAVTVDWVVLTAAVAGLSLVVLIPVLSTIESASNTANVTLQSASSQASETN